MTEIADFLNRNGWTCEDCSSWAIFFCSWDGVVMSWDTRQSVSNYTGLSDHAYKVGFFSKAYC